MVDSHTKKPTRSIVATWITKSWGLITKNTIINTWRRTGISGVTNMTVTIAWPAVNAEGDEDVFDDPLAVQQVDSESSGGEDDACTEIIV